MTLVLRCMVCDAEQMGDRFEDFDGWRDPWDHWKDGEYYPAILCPAHYDVDVFAEAKVA